MELAVRTRTLKHDHTTASQARPALQGAFFVEKKDLKRIELLGLGARALEFAGKPAA